MTMTVPAIKPPSSRISARVLLLFAAVLIVLLVVLLVAVFITVSNTEAVQWQGRQAEAARNAVFRVQSFLGAAQRELGIAAQFSDLVDRPQLPALLLSDNNAFLEVLFVDEAGKVLANEFRDRSVLGASAFITQANWFLQATARPDTVYVSSIQLAADTRPYVVMALATRETPGVVAVRLSLDVFSELINELSFGSTGRAYVVGDDGFVLAHSNPDVVAANINVGGRPEFRQATMFDTQTLEYENFERVFVVGTSERIPALNWLIVTEIVEDEVYTGTTQSLTVLMVTGLIVFVAALAVMAVVLRQFIFNPLSQLRGSLDRVAQGDYDARIPLNRADEVGEVIKAFNDMIRIVGERAIERDRLIRDLQAAKRLAEENSRLKSEFLSTMSHELRTPMNAIEGFVGIILNKMGGADFNEKTASYLHRVRANSQRLLALINDFLDLSRVESGRLDLARLPFEPVKLAQRWRSELGVLAENKGIGFEVEVDPRLPQTLVGDEEAISKVAINLIGNVIKFTEQGKVSLTMRADGDFWHIIVADTGIGIPAHAREFVFEEFRQVDQTSKRKYGGTGLGLAIVQKYTRSMGGQVTLKSEIGKGSEFTVSLPMVTAAQMRRLQEV